MHLSNKSQYFFLFFLLMLAANTALICKKQENMSPAEEEANIKELTNTIKFYAYGVAVLAQLFGGFNTKSFCFISNLRNSSDHQIECYASFPQETESSIPQSIGTPYAKGSFNLEEPYEKYNREHGIHRQEPQEIVRNLPLFRELWRTAVLKPGEMVSITSFPDPTQEDGIKSLEPKVGSELKRLSNHTNRPSFASVTPLCSSEKTGDRPTAYLLFQPVIREETEQYEVTYDGSRTTSPL